MHLVGRQAAARGVGRQGIAAAAVHEIPGGGAADQQHHNNAQDDDVLFDMCARPLRSGLLDRDQNLPPVPTVRWKAASCPAARHSGTDEGGKLDAGDRIDIAGWSLGAV